MELESFIREFDDYLSDDFLSKRVVEVLSHVAPGTMKEKMEELFIIKKRGMKLREMNFQKVRLLTRKILHLGRFGDNDSPKIRFQTSVFLMERARILNMIRFSNIALKDLLLALELCESVLEFDLDEAEVKSILSQIYSEVSVSYYDINDPERALGFASKAISTDVSNVDGYWTRALSLSIINEDDPRRLNDIEKSLSLDPNSIDAIIVNTWSMISKKEFSQAWEYLSKFEELGKTNHYYYYCLSHIYDDLRSESSKYNKNSENNDELRKEEEEEEEDVPAILKDKKGLRELSLLSMLKSILLEPRCEISYSSLGYLIGREIRFIELGLKYHDYAEDIIKKNWSFEFVKSNDENGREIVGHPDFCVKEGKGFLLLRQGKFKEAIEEFRKIVEVDPGHHPSFSNIAFCYTYIPNSKKLTMLNVDKAIRACSKKILKCHNDKHGGGILSPGTKLRKLQKLLVGYYVDRSYYYVIHKADDSDKGLDPHMIASSFYHGNQVSPDLFCECFRRIYHFNPRTYSFDEKREYTDDEDPRKGNIIEDCIEYYEVDMMKRSDLGKIVPLDVVYRNLCFLYRCSGDFGKVGEILDKTEPRKDWMERYFFIIDNENREEEEDEGEEGEEESMVRSVLKNRKKMMVMKKKKKVKKEERDKEFFFEIKKEFVPKGLERGKKNVVRIIFEEVRVVGIAKFVFTLLNNC